jgi:L-amino acid N-acyltransferase
MREPPIIRLATPADLEAIQRIYNHAIATTTATWDEAPWTSEQRQQWFEDHRADCPALVAERDTHVVGFGTLSPMSQKSGWRFTRENSIYVDEPHRGTGVGTALLEALIAQARAAPLHTIVAIITGENEVSLRLHYRFGFQDAGILREAGLKFGQRHDARYLQLLLG